jgi:hypothetical protein
MKRQGLFWSEAEDAELLRRYKSGEPLDLLAADLDRTKDAMADRYRRLKNGGGKAEKRSASPPPKQKPPTTLRKLAEINILHVGACMREAGVVYLDDLAAYYRSRCEKAIEPGSTVTIYTPTSFADGRSCVGSQAAMCESA